MRKIISVTLAAALAFSLSACGKKEKKEENFTEKMTVETTDETVYDDTEAIESEDTEVEETETVTVEYNLKNIYHRFKDGFAWIEISKDGEGSTLALVNENLQVVYEVYYEYGLNYNYSFDILNGKALYEKSGGQGFVVIDTEGNVLYENEDAASNINFTEDGGVVYCKSESESLTTEDGYYVYALDSNMEPVSSGVCTGEDSFGSDIILEDFVYIKDGVYAGVRVNSFNNDLSDGYIINMNNNSLYTIGYGVLRVFTDEELNAGLGYYYGNAYGGTWGYFVDDASSIDFNSISSEEEFIDYMENNFSKIEDEEEYEFLCRYGNGKLLIGRLRGDSGYSTIEGLPFELPDLGFKVEDFCVAYGGMYYGFLLQDEGENSYCTVFDSSGNMLYEPLQTDLESMTIGASGYLVDLEKGKFITPEGQVLSLGEGDDMSVLKEEHISDEISSGFFYAYGDLYKLDGTVVTTVTAQETAQ
jgi:hypothetical protein